MNTESFVEHSPSTVMALKVSSVTSLKGAVGAGSARSGRRSSGTRAWWPSSARSCRSPSPSRRSRRTPAGDSTLDGGLLGPGVRRHDGLGRGPARAPVRATRRPVSSPRPMASTSSPIPITPVDAISTCSRGQPTTRRRQLRHPSGVGHAGVSRAGIGASAVDRDRSRHPGRASQVLTAHDDRCGSRLGWW